ncbi:hypothetical protein M0R45_005555 [Rubus argutus]|uniref:Uncharacterized protein n=1 Tax=Rubus argutus TaxID=59490 RepID=A0AAW1YNB0_RUBAR
MKLAQAIKENPPTNKSSFIKEYIDAHNNIGLLELDCDNMEEAEKILTKALVICDQEEVTEYDDARTRLHHNLGKLYTELRMWDNAREHIEKDILICKQIGHCEGEAKGYINLERNFQLKHIASLNVLIDKSETISAWSKVLEFAKMKKNVATELCDKEKIGDSFLVIGESYLKLRKFQKALKWCMKSLKMYKSLGNLEGQAYRLALEAKLPNVQLIALENMHYSNLNRFDDVEERPGNLTCNPLNTIV